MNNTMLLPAIRSHVGDWIFYITTLSFEVVKNYIKEPDEVHERKKLSEWIQREVIKNHSDAISNYIIENEQRFLGALIIGVYDGRPDWAPLNVKFTSNYLDATHEQREKIEGKLGLLRLTGDEKLFSIDGQHRVAGIKKALKKVTDDSKIRNDEVSAIFVSHDGSTAEGKQRTRRLFTTVNKKAKKIAKAAIIALDEDNGFAIVTRRLIDEHWLFQDDKQHILYTSTGSIPANDENGITSVVGLYEIIKDLHPQKGKKKFEQDRPTDDQLDEFLAFCSKYLDILLHNVPEYKAVFVDQSFKASDFRKGENNHLLFRPVGQRAFAKAVQLQISRGNEMPAVIKRLLQVNMKLDSVDWCYILWNPINRTMITNDSTIPETQLLSLAGLKARNEKAEKKLKTLLKSIANKR